MRCNEDADLVYECDKEGREKSCHKHSLFVDCIASFRPHLISCFFDLFRNVQNRLICNIFHKHKTNITPIVNIDQTTNITCFVGNKLPEDNLAV